MPIYEYECTECAHEFDVVKSVKQLNDVEACHSCKSENTKRNIAKPNVYVEAWESHWSPVMGKVVRSNVEVRQYAKDHNLVEVGNECPNKSADHYEKQRKDKWQKSYDDINLNLGEIRSRG